MGYIFIYLIIFICMAFFTLIEEQILCIIHQCKGPGYVGYLGVLQPFSYVLKLLSYYYLNSSFKDKYLFFYSPFLRLLIAILLWVLCPFIYILILVQWRLLFLIIVRQ